MYLCEHHFKFNGMSYEHINSCANTLDCLAYLEHEEGVSPSDISKMQTELDKILARKGSTPSTKKVNRYYVAAQIMRWIAPKKLIRRRQTW